MAEPTPIQEVIFYSGFAISAYLAHACFSDILVRAVVFLGVPFALKLFLLEPWHIGIWRGRMRRMRDDVASFFGNLYTTATTNAITALQQPWRWWRRVGWGGIMAALRAGLASCLTRAAAPRWDGHRRGSAAGEHCDCLDERVAALEHQLARARAVIDQHRDLLERWYGGGGGNGFAMP